MSGSGPEGDSPGGLAAWTGVARAPFLLLPFTLVAAGVAAGAWDGAFDALHTAVALVGLVALHVAVNVLNEWSDLRTGIDLHTSRTPFSGGSGSLPAGAMAPRTALAFGLGAAALGLLCGLWLLSRVGWVLLPFMVAGAILVLGYTDFLARTGFGEIAAGLGLGGLPVAGTALVQGGGLGSAALWAGVPATLMTFNLLLLNEFPDEEADRGGGRRNLVILFGRKTAARVYGAAGVLTPLAVVGGVVTGAFPWPALLGALPSLLLAAPLRWCLSAPEDPVPIPALGANVAWNLATNVLLAAGIAGGLLLGGFNL